MAVHTIEGGAIDDIASFYAEINRVFMAGENWRLGQSLDAFNDLLFGGFGAIESGEATSIVWRDIEHSRAALGIEATREFYRAKLGNPQYNQALAQAGLDALEAGTGQTYFEMIVEIIAQHESITLIPA